MIRNHKNRIWEPPYEIRRKNEIYVYVGDIPNTKHVKESEIRYVHEQGRKVVHIVDKLDKKVICQYVSKKFYFLICKVQHPAWGKQSIGRNR